MAGLTLEQAKALRLQWRDRAGIAPASRSMTKAKLWCGADAVKPMSGDDAANTLPAMAGAPEPLENFCLRRSGRHPIPSLYLCRRPLPPVSYGGETDAGFPRAVPLIRQAATATFRRTYGCSVATACEWRLGGRRKDVGRGDPRRTGPRDGIFSVD